MDRGMKVLLLSLFVSLLMVGCGESSQPSEDVDTTDTDPEKAAIDSAVDWSKLQDRNGTMYLPNAETPFTGRAESFYENGQKELESNYKDGKPDGLWTWLYGSGQKEREGNYKDGKKDGLVTWWYENGQKKVEGNFKDGKPDGMTTSWYENGQKSREENYKDGKENGLSTTWYKNGQKKRETNYKDGEVVD